jgi:uncharacterized repeat protein (TIGR01451 family)
LSRSPRTRPVRHLLASFFLVAATLGLSAITSSPASADPPAGTITSAGPLTSIFASPDLNCAVHHVGDDSGEFYDDTACGTFVTVPNSPADGYQLYGPQNVPSGPSPDVAYTPVSQTPVTGSGTEADPYQMVTVADVQISETQTIFRLTQTDTYVVGQESYRTDVEVKNMDAAQQDGVLYRAGDCYLQNSDSGFGNENPDGSVACVSSEDGSPGSRIEQWSPITSGSHYDETNWPQIWTDLQAGIGFLDTCRCADDIDNGAGLSWNFSLAPGASKTFSEIMTFSPLGTQPLVTTKTADQDTVQAGGGDGYTIQISNPNIQDATLDTITDDLPNGFTYSNGSTTGDVDVDPTGSSSLTWTGPFNVPAGGSLQLHFSVTAASDPGDYFNNAGGTGEGVTVVPTGNTAKVTVNGPAGADLSVSQTDSPDPVNSGNDVLYHVTVTNNGPDPADNVTLDDNLDGGGSLVSATPVGETGVCFDTEGGGAGCNFGTMGSGETHEADIVFQAPGTSEGTSITNNVDVSSNTDDPIPANDHSEESTQVDPAGQGSGGNQGSSGYIPPSGGSLTTDPGSGPTPGDPTVITLKLGNGPGGVGSVEELDASGEADCAANPDLGPCIGDVGNFLPPDGYSKARAILVFDKDAVRGGLKNNRRPWHVMYDKNGTVQELAKCSNPRVPASEVPCWTSIFRDANRDLHVKVLINSDPKLAGRK